LLSERSPGLDFRGRFANSPEGKGRGNEREEGKGGERGRNSRENISGCGLAKLSFGERLVAISLP